MDKYHQQFFTLFIILILEKKNANNICKDNDIMIIESFLNKISNINVDMDSNLFLTHKNINIFNIFNGLYANFYFIFESLNGKDAPLYL